MFKLWCAFTVTGSIHYVDMLVEVYSLCILVIPVGILIAGLCNIQQLVADAIRWMDAAKFLTGASAVGSVAIPIILRHAGLIGTGAMFIEFTSFFIFVCTVLCFHRASLDDEW
ncbi:UNVERIFIED_CONTAM: Vacuolar protein sorting-associated protein 55 [Sesamum radiatum]|uniref:Vacuolar protein sorting-associated protein 55 n=1 Tax=Sesamum radiatum TaxID=300843 RepID=A0AAW2P2S8_SESRA